MTQKQTPHHTPPLRFPEFRGAGAWEVKKLGDMFELYQPKTLSRSQFKQSGQYNVYGANGIIGRHDKHNHKDSEVIVTCRGATCGEIHYTEPEVWITGNAMVVKPKDDDLSKIFIMHYLKNHGLKSVISGSAQPQITREGLAPLPIALPPPAEQQKIAECLSSLDEAIMAHSDRLDRLNSYKRGLMQLLFPAKGQTIPTRRFLEFQGKDSWQEKPLCKIANVIAGQSPEGSSYNKEEIGVPFYQGKTNFGDIYLKKPTTWTTQTTKLAQEGDILMSVRAPVGALNISTGEICIGRGVASIQAKQNKWYLYYFLKKNEKYIVGNGGSIFDSINKSQIEAIKILIPPTIEEQHRIADCLSSIDDSITAQKQTIKDLKNYKNGLMQQLFPKIEELKQ